MVGTDAIIMAEQCCSSLFQQCCSALKRQQRFFTVVGTGENNIDRTSLFAIVIIAVLKLYWWLNDAQAAQHCQRSLTTCNKLYVSTRANLFLFLVSGFPVRFYSKASRFFEKPDYSDWHKKRMTCLLTQKWQNHYWETKSQCRRLISFLLKTTSKVWTECGAWLTIVGGYGWAEWKMNEEPTTAVFGLKLKNHSFSVPGNPSLQRWW